MPVGADRYRRAGVDLAAAEAAKARIAELVRGTRTEASVGAVGAFGGLVRLPADVARPVLVASTDGVGTKVLVAIRAGRHDTVGEDLVNHCVNDILVHGARPVGFLDYFASGRLDPAVAAEVVSGVARACRAHAMPLVGGETAEMPDVYRPGEYDLAGTILGVVAEDEALHGDRVAPGDVLVGYASSGFHTNGYSLLRRVIFGDLALGLDDPFPETDRSVAAVLLAVHQSYFAAVWPVRAQLHALAHITGGGIPGNLVRVLPSGVDAAVRGGSWPVPAPFEVVRRGGAVSVEEMRRVFNLGVGLIAVCARADAAAVRSAAREAGVETWEIGAVVTGRGAVRWGPEGEGEA
ncbi:MAG TPA: phosphoribosylformylglycinamidine cyclo-ligase [Gemmatimonadales bacterium]|nr:phosphoribosylformylglycinamidine cyclo-ligase [Gemmatimonadales bacterium]